MSHITACPECKTRFRVTDEQLQVREGKVRCGKCAHVFNALETLTDEIPLPASPQPVQPEPDIAFFPEQDETTTPAPEIQPEETVRTEAGFAVSPAPELTIESVAPDAPEEPDLLAPSAYPAPPAPETENAFEILDRLVSPASESAPEPGPDNKTETRVVRIQPPPTIIQPKVSPASPKYAPPPKPRRAWPWVLASLLLLAGLAVQGIYFFRDTIAAHYPPTRALLEQACAPFQCQVGLLRNPDLISIESSELHADPARASIVVLTSILRNRANHVQAYPTLELTLTNARDEMVARILFSPKEYLRNPAAIPQGIPGGAEIAVKLLMDIGELKAEGYRLYLFYPPQP